MEIRLLENDKKNFKLSFVIKDSTAAIVNAVRRNAISKVLTMAIEDVEFKENSSVLYDEIVAHRLGLIPLKTDLRSYTLPIKCKCEGKGCAHCQLKLTLKAKGPAVVYASDIKSKDPKVVPVYPETPIAKLTKGQELELEATAVLGSGEDHIKWSPGLVYYKNKPIVEIIKDCENREEVVKACPLKIFELKDGKMSVNKDNLLKCHLCEACIDICRPKGAIKIDKSNDFVFYVESWGQLSAKEIVERSLDSFDDQLDGFTEALKKAK
ncbi:DNA-directed RNA polymerase subunit D [Candidatus Woesearchaeota archaeon]|nr:DNA-directed RNA polymerase subunit D [Candidatus Woesearchaeota archaeon]